MKTQKFSLAMAMFFAFSLLLSTQAFSQEKKKVETAEIKSSVVCGMCEERVIKDLAFEKGVKDVKVDLKTKMITVKYKTSKTNEETIKKAITEIGYDADEMQADPVAYEKLPACCRKDAPPH
ncbi:MAG: heavy-metal-associated domain-containing protein [Bacteroidales bacterium]